MGTEMTVTLMKPGRPILLTLEAKAPTHLKAGQIRTDGWADPAPAAPTHTVARHSLPLGQIIKKFTTTSGVY